MALVNVDEAHSGQIVVGIHLMGMVERIRASPREGGIRCACYRNELFGCPTGSWVTFGRKISK